MRREDYEEAKNKNPDWDKVAARDLKTWTKLFIFDSVLTRKEYKSVIEKVQKRIENFVELIDTEEIKKKYRAELFEYAEEIYKWTQEHFGQFTPYLLSLAITNAALSKQEIRVLETRGAAMVDLTRATASNAPEGIVLPMQKASGYSSATSAGMFYKDLQQLLKSEVQNFLNLEVKPKYYANVNPRSMAEMIVRFNKYKAQREELTQKGVELVYVPPHTNCSKRCQPWQGRIYSLTGKSGTVDGKKYVPIEEAADNQTYTSPRTGRTYFNGLFSYNCRHELQEYQNGMVIEKIPDSVIERRREIEAQQRKMERDYRALREKEELYRIIGNRSNNKGVLKIATETRKKAAALRREYEDFSRKNKITFFPNRLQIMEGENRYVRTIGKNDGIAQAALKMKNEA